MLDGFYMNNTLSAALWGLSRTVVQEFPDIGWQIHDHDAAASSRTQLGRSTGRPLLANDDNLYGLVVSCGARISAVLNNSSTRYLPAAIQLLPEPRG
jgi:hypothetical protein